MRGLCTLFKISKRGSSFRSPLTGNRVKVYGPLIISITVRGPRRVKVIKVTLRVAEKSGRILERDVVGSINIGFKYLYPDGSLVALGSTGIHEM